MTKIMHEKEGVNREADYRTFVSLFLAAFKEGICLAKEAEDNGLHLFRHINYPRMSSLENGMPVFSKAYGDDIPKDYGCIFRGKNLSHALLGIDPIFPNDRFQKTQELVKFADNSEVIKSMLIKPEYRNTLLGASVDYTARQLLGDCVDRYIHVYASFDVEDKRLMAVFSPIFRAFVQRSYPVTIVIPIAVIPFEFERIKIAKRTYIMKMNDVFQLSRYSVSNRGSGAHSTFVGAATHAFVFTDWHFNDIKSYHDIQHSISSTDAFPKKEIDVLFAALRLATGYETGYAQLIYWPRGWAWGYVAGLLSLTGTTVRQYPNTLDNYGWNKKFDALKETDAKLIGQLYSALLECEYPQIEIAIKRLNSCYLRDNDEDTIIDACIGLEALLSDGDGNEMTHKLALRLAALKKLRYEDVLQTFKETKDIYSVRSSIVHGGKRNNKKNRMSNEEAAKKSVILLSDCIKTLLENKEFLDPKEIDNRLLLGK